MTSTLRTLELSALSDLQALAVNQHPDWMLRGVTGFPHGDGRIQVEAEALVVEPACTDPDTGQPRFSEPDMPLNFAEHLRWAVLARPSAQDGPPGLPLAGARTATLNCGISAELFNTAHTPSNQREKIGDGSVATILMDRESGMVFDFILTNRTVYAVYERLAFPPSPAASFTYAVPVADSLPDQHHNLSIQIDVVSRSVTWSIEGRSVIHVSSIGPRLPRSYDKSLLRDNRAASQEVFPRQLTCGAALFAGEIYGQGARMRIAKLSLTLEEDGI